MNHDQLAEDYYKLAQKGKNEDIHPGYSWRAVMFFYAALHAVDHTLRGLGKRPKDHFERRQMVKMTPQLTSLDSDYTALEGLSQQARYYPARCPLLQEEMQDAWARAKKILEALGIPTK